MSNLHKRMLKDMQLRGFSPKTQYRYIMNLKSFEKYFSQPAENMGQDELRDFLHYLINDKKVSSSYVNGVYSALKFFYANTLDRSWDMKQIPRVKKARKLPVILSKNDIKRLLAATTNLKFRAMFMIAYSAGLRVSEIANLKISDIDSENMQIFVRQAKGQIDRYSILSETCLAALRDYWKAYRPLGWLFPGKIPGEPIRTRAIQDAFYKMRIKAGLSNEASIHSLRHSFATHLLEEGVNLVYIQQLLGHARISTTTLYLHLAKVKILKVKSPLDSLDED